MTRAEQQLLTIPIPGDRSGLDRWIRSVVSLFDAPRRHLKITPAAEVGNAVTFTIQVRDRKKNHKPGRHLILVWFSATATGSPTTSQTVSVITITGAMIVKTLTTDGVYLLATDDAGAVRVTATIAGAATRYCNGHYLGPLDQSGAATWA